MVKKVSGTIVILFCAALLMGLMSSWSIAAPKHLILAEAGRSDPVKAKAPGKTPARVRSKKDGYCCARIYYAGYLMGAINAITALMPTWISPRPYVIQWLEELGQLMILTHYTCSKTNPAFPRLAMRLKQLRQLARAVSNDPKWRRKVDNYTGRAWIEFSKDVMAVGASKPNWQKKWKMPTCTECYWIIGNKLGWALTVFTFVKTKGRIPLHVRRNAVFQAKTSVGAALYYIRALQSPEATQGNRSGFCIALWRPELGIVRLLREVVTQGQDPVRLHQVTGLIHLRIVSALRGRGPRIRPCPVGLVVGQATKRRIKKRAAKWRLEMKKYYNMTPAKLRTGQRQNDKTKIKP